MGNNRDLPFQGSNVELEYNGYKFYETSRCMVKATPVYQNDEVTVKYVRYSITVHAIVTAGDLLSQDRDPATDGAYDDYPLDADEDTNVNLADLRNVLTTPRRTLKFKNLGFGDLVVGPQETIQDVDYGPKPRALVWEPIGADQTARVIWTVEFCIPECTDIAEPHSVDLYKFLEYTYTESFSYNADGGVARKIEGYVEIADDPYSSQLQVELFKLKHKFIPPPLVNCKRTEASFTIAANKKSATFNTVDVVIMSQYEVIKGVTKIDANHSLGNMNDNSGNTIGANWLNTLRVKIRLHRDLTFTTTGRQLSWLVFLRILDERLGEGYRTSGGTSFPIVRKLLVDHNLTEPEFTFVCSWVLVVNTYQDVFSRSNFWEYGRNVYDGSITWQNSILPNDDHRLSQKINDSVSLKQKAVTYCNQNFDLSSQGIDYATLIPELGTTPYILYPQCPPEQLSYVDFKNNYKVMGQRQLAINYALQDPDPIQESEGIGKVTGGDPKLDNSHEKGLTASSSNVISQRMGNSVVKVLMWGYSLKYNSPTTIPEMTEYGGKKAILLQEWIEPAILVEENPCPLYATTWYKIYQLDNFTQETKPTGRGVINGLQTGTTNPQDPTANNNTIASNGYV